MYASVVKYILQIFFVLFIGYGCYDYGYKKSETKYLTITNKQLQEQEARYQGLQQKLKQTQQDKENEIKAINSKHNAIVSSLRNRPERITSKENNDCPSVCTRTGSTGEQLFREDAEFLIGEASKAMILKESLTACRRYLLEINQ